MTERSTIDVSLSDIAKRSGLNSALVKYYFGSKQGLLLALVEEVLGRGMDQMEGLLTMEIDPVEKLKLHIKGIITVYFRYPFINRLLHHMYLDPELDTVVGERISKPLATLQRQILEQCASQGRIRPVNPTMFYFIVVGACDHLFFGQQALRIAFGIDGVDDDLRRTYTGTLIDLLMNGMLVPDAKPL
ncbi:TetR family transcriptional regulator [Sphingomonas sp. CGMCC 1.13654]|uniref:TetR family transcriptional regulator n=2 Tax=Sphingomonas chungangi TaxID=2683589 RepID=A0A838L8I1_9SPHN|nr:TetR family transcriptional regulator [Sphingomonas chungangi]